MSNNRKTIYRDFVNGESVNEQVIAEFTSSIDGAGYPTGNDQQQRLLFTVQNDQTDDKGNHVGSINFTPNINAAGHVEDSSLSVFLKSSGSGADDSLTEAFTVSGDGGFTSKSLTINRPDTESDVF